MFSIGFCGGLRNGKAKFADVMISRTLSTYMDSNKQIVNNWEQWCGNSVNVCKKTRDGSKALLNDPEVHEILYRFIVMLKS